MHGTCNWNKWSLKWLVLATEVFKLGPGMKIMMFKMFLLFVYLLNYPNS
jgi:hypothetical protein